MKNAYVDYGPGNVLSLVYLLCLFLRVARNTDGDCSRLQAAVYYEVRNCQLIGHILSNLFIYLFSGAVLF